MPAEEEPKRRALEPSPADNCLELYCLPPERRMRVVVLGCVRRPRSGPSSSMNSPCSSSSGSRQAGRQAGRQPARSQTGLHQPKTKKRGARGRGGDENNLQWILTSRGEMGWTDSNSTTSPVRCLLLYHFILVPPCPRARLPSGSPHPVLPPRPKNKKKHHRWVGRRVVVPGPRVRSSAPLPSALPLIHAAHTSLETPTVRVPIRISTAM